MSDKFDAMTNKEVAAATLEMMGYEEKQSGEWCNDEGKTHFTRGWFSVLVYHPAQHAFAAEVKQYMMDEVDKTGGRKWAYEEEWDNDESIGYLGFIAEDRWLLREATQYTNMDEHPRAVCLAALRAKEAEDA